MKFKSIIKFIFVAPILFLAACNEDIEVTAPGEETAVVYGLLDASESVHYIKINKAFISGSNSLETALIADSNYFSSVEATITEINQGVVTRTWTLQDTIIENKEPGVFYFPEQKVYYFTTPTNQPLIANVNCKYQLSAVINNGEFTIAGETIVVPGISISTPSASIGEIALVSQGNYISYGMKFNTGLAKTVEVNVYPTFDEYIDGVPTAKTFTWRVASISEGIAANNQERIIPIPGQTFYSLVRDNCTNNPAIDRRVLRSLRFEVIGGSDDLQRYLTLSKPSSSLAQNKPLFTNLTATNDRKVLGIFSSRNTITTELKDTDLTGGNPKRILSVQSRLELYTGPITGLLHFCSQYAQDAGQPYHCD